MNWLAHLWLADRSGTSAAGQLLGDHIKGRLADQHLDDDIALGVWLHRRIDSTTDAHPAHRELRARFGPALRRYSGIIVDIGFDHALARQWPTLGTPETLEAFAHRLARDVVDGWPSDITMAPPLATSLAALLEGYAMPDGAARALRHVGKRLRRDNPLGAASTCHALLAETTRFENALAPLLADLERQVMADIVSAPPERQH